MLKCIGWIIVISAFFLAACSTPPPKHQNNICAIFQQHPSWYWDAQVVQHHWGVPISVQMAIIHEESHFLADAEPPHQRLWGVLPWFRPTSANGYAQATRGSWRAFVHAMGMWRANPAHFKTAVMFIGWYVERIHRKLNLSFGQVFEIYLAYHEGIEGYAHGSYWDKPQLVSIAHHVQAQANRYHWQLVRCEHELPRKPWWHFWS